MGGRTFSVPQDGKPALENFPRMPPALYIALRERVRELLSTYFTTVTFLPEAPEKPDHGDLDVLIHSSSGNNPGLERIAEVLGAVQSRSPGLTSWTLALPIDAACFQNVDVDAYGPDFSAALVQVDLRVCKELNELHWRGFKNGYGDLWQILGVLIRPIGLTVDESHLCVRIQEVEDGSGSKEDTKVRLCDEPDEVLVFLGLDVEEYRKGFETEMQVFQWCVRCRFFSTASLFRHVDGSAEEGVEGAVQPQSANINHNDRQRFRKRAMFVRFHGWVRRNLTTLSKRNTTLTRADVFDRAVSRYNKHVHVDAVLKRHRRIVREKTLKDRVAALIRENVLERPAVLAGVKEEHTAEEREKRVHDAVSRILRGMRSFVLLDVKGKPFVARSLHPGGTVDSASKENNPASKENDPAAQEISAQALAQSQSQDWADITLGDDEFVDWVSRHWHEVDALEIERRNVGYYKKTRRKQVVEAREGGADAVG